MVLFTHTMNKLLARFTLTLIVLILGGTLFVKVGDTHLAKRDPALKLLRIPLIPDLLYTAIEAVYLAFELLGIPSPFFLVPVSESIQLCLGLAYALFTYRNLKINDIKMDGYIPFPWIAALTAVNGAVLATRFMNPAAAGSLLKANKILLAAILLYTGACAVASRWKKEDLYPSTKGGFWMAFFCLVYVPFIGLAEIFSLPVANFSTARSVVLQAFPAREFVVLAIFASHLEPLYSRLWQNHAALAPDLSAREREIADLLRKGLSNTAIADRLYISLPTVKTHVRNVLKKYGLTSRAEIMKGLAN